MACAHMAHKNVAATAGRDERLRYAARLLDEIVTTLDEEQVLFSAAQDEKLLELAQATLVRPNTKERHFAEYIIKRLRDSGIEVRLVKA